MAGDTEPIEILLHLPLLAEDKVWRQLCCSPHLRNCSSAPMPALCQRSNALTHSGITWLGWIWARWVVSEIRRGMCSTAECPLRLRLVKSSSGARLWRITTGAQMQNCVSGLLSSAMLFCTACGCTRRIANVTNLTAGDCCIGHNKRGQPAEVADPDAEDRDREAAVSVVQHVHYVCLDPLVNASVPASW